MIENVLNLNERENLNAKNKLSKMKIIMRKINKLMLKVWLKKK